MVGQDAMIESIPRGAIVYASGLESKTISRHFESGESGTLLEYVLDSLWTVADELIVVFRDNEPPLSIIEAISPLGGKVLTTSGGRTPLEMVYSAFKSARSDHCLLTTERFPLLKPNVALALYENAQGQDLAIPVWKDGRLEPLLSVYRKKAFVRVVDGLSEERSIRGRSRKEAAKARLAEKAGHLSTDLSHVVERLFAVKHVPIDAELRELDPELDSFLEVKDDRTLGLAQTKASTKSLTMRARRTSQRDRNTHP
jgi:molybdopterin-guanine dinucleotide biosynthesis protein A